MVMRDWRLWFFGVVVGQFVTIGAYVVIGPARAACPALASLVPL
jgi:hypothetical protein